MTRFTRCRIQTFLACGSMVLPCLSVSWFCALRAQNQDTKEDKALLCRRLDRWLCKSC